MKHHGREVATMTSGTRESYQAAVDRARAVGGGRKAQDLGGGRYLVVGRRGDEYRVCVDPRGDYACTCPAGQQGNPCWHQAAVWIKRLGLPKLDPRDPDTALLARPSGVGIGMSRRW